ncbi:branched-chain amino acid transaminase [Candidatus Peregrinibacteria bacterium]|nr:branched-chain amino acid transaminase [Candidatus Peregrinibacteria bacterium]
MKLKSTKYVWMDGKFISWKKATVHLITHTLHYGAGVFEGIRFYKTPKGTVIFRLTDHIKRLFYSAGAIGVKVPFSEKEVHDAVIRLVKKNEIKSGYIRPLIWYGEGHMGINPIGAPVNIAIACWPWGLYLKAESIRVKTSSFMRIHPKSTVHDAKISGHYANSIQAVLEVKKAGYDEALFLDYKGHVAEGPGENIFMVKNHVLITPAKGSILPGFTRDSIMKLAKDMGYQVMEKSFKLKDLYAADEVFLTGTAAEVVPVREVDKKKIGNGKVGPITQVLYKAFMEVVNGNHSKYKKWLTYVN